MSEGKRVALVLAGCGYLDGAEIHEATLTMLSLDRRGVTVKTLPQTNLKCTSLTTVRLSPKKGRQETC